MSDGLLAGKSVLVVGASSGIGAATARICAREGARVVLAARSGVQSVCQGIRESGGDADSVLTDATDLDQVTEMFRLSGRVDVVIHCAAEFHSGAIESTSPESWTTDVLRTLDSAYNVAHTAFNHMKTQGGGSIVMVASIGAIPGVEKFPGNSAYTAAKSSVSALGESLAVEGRPYGIRSIVVSPGAVDTAMLRRAAPHLSTSLRPDDIGEVLMILSSPHAAALSGSVIPVHSHG
jgi:NAD(P)-dependent dehydrogenase (short-subunit alcohol dehydrogenase family)